ncbi:hypothetical protein SAMN04487930_12017 [Cytophaga hutchinsonii ATCC 33406]|nr:hypothetical protein SAMN04487930_12017 [Cytophaga hutchinsonii ATCC 33406]
MHVLSYFAHVITVFFLSDELNNHTLKILIIKNLLSNPAAYQDIK